jgi:uncharacterized protein (TIGR02757 family)
MPRHTPITDSTKLRTRLDQLVATFDLSHLEPDPLQLVRAYDDPLDQEVVGLIAAAFAYGRADIVVTNIGRVLKQMGPSPWRYLNDEFKPVEARRRFRGFTHRFHKTTELVALLHHLALTLRQHGSLGALFRLCHDENDSDIGPTLSRFVGRIIAMRPADPRTKAALQYMLTSPADGSACKRMNLFLRWMVRRTSPDLGLWRFVSPSKLIMPLDTHVRRISTFLGLNQRKSADWKTARAVTDRLAEFDRDDPVRYDYALCRLGILDLCSIRRRKEQCDVCLLRDVCRFPVV